MFEREIEDPKFFRGRIAFAPRDDHLEVRCWIGPGGGMLPHVHPRTEERFEVVGGSGTFHVDGARRPAAEGDVVVVAPGVRHEFRNTSHAEVRLRCEVRPPDGLQEFLEAAIALGRAGLVNERGLPTSPRGALAVAVAADAWFDTTQMASPPPALQRLVLPPLARLGRRRGLTPGGLAGMAAA